MNPHPPLTPEQEADAIKWVETHWRDRPRLPREKAVVQRIRDLFDEEMECRRMYADACRAERERLALESDLHTLSLDVGLLEDDRARVALLAVKEKIAARVLKEGGPHAQGADRAAPSSVLVSFTEARREIAC